MENDTNSCNTGTTGAKSTLLNSSADCVPPAQQVTQQQHTSFCSDRFSREMLFSTLLSCQFFKPLHSTIVSISNVASVQLSSSASKVINYNPDIEGKSKERNVLKISYVLIALILLNLNKNKTGHTCATNAKHKISEVTAHRIMRRCYNWLIAAVYVKLTHD